MKFFELLIEIVGWIKIAISPTLIGVIVGMIVYASQQNVLGMILGIIIAVAGLIVGIIWATRIFRSKKGTMYYVSRIHATPELDEEAEE